MIQKFPRHAAMLFAAMALAVAFPKSYAAEDPSKEIPTLTPIKHIVVLFQENISFDHYFGTYPYATNPSGEPEFRAESHTPRANNLLSGGLLDQNPNEAQPFRLDRTCPLTSDQGHSYTPEQKAFDHGLMDAFVQNTGSTSATCGIPAEYATTPGNPSIVMGYYDGNTVTAWWNLAQHYALSDNFYGTMFGPSSVGALNVTAGTTTNMTITGETTAVGTIAGGGLNGTLIGDIDPGYDDCSTATKHGTIAAGSGNSGINIGTLLSDANITWGWFQGGFAPTSVVGGKAVCGSVSSGIAVSGVTDYVSHHNPFDYFAATANQHHLPPTKGIPIGAADPAGANHQYDLSVFLSSIAGGTLPTVSYVKAKAFQNGHPGNSDPLDEQTWLVTAVNALENSKYWDDTAIIITYDDSDGWYDHQMDTIVNQSDSPTDDDLTGPGACGTTPSGGQPGRCGYGPRLPLIVISKYAKTNYIDHRMTDQSSVVRFIEDNWKLPSIGGDSSDVKAGSLFGFFDFDRAAHRINLDPATGQLIFEYPE